MRVRWTHDGVTLRGPVRFARRLRAGAAAWVGAMAVLTAAALGALRPVEPARDWEICAVEPELAPCAELRPDWMAWSFADRDAYVAARMCTLLHPVLQGGRAVDSRAVAEVDPERGLDLVGNLAFLAMINRQTGACAVPDVPMSHEDFAFLVRYGGTGAELGAAAIGVARREYEVLRVLERGILTDRARATAARERERVARQSARHAAVSGWAWLWSPSLCAAWLVALVGARRLVRRARPLELAVDTRGVALDGRRTPIADIAWLELDGQRLRVVRWSGSALRSRPLPPEALEAVDEICAAYGIPLHEEGAGPAEAPESLRNVITSARSGPARPSFGLAGCRLPTRP